MKFSEEREKITLPSSKSVLRLFDEKGLPIMDILCLKDEESELIKYAGKEVEFYKTRADDCPLSKVVPHTIQSITNPLFQAKQTTAMQDRREQVLKKLQIFGGIETLLENDEPYGVYMSKALFELFQKKF